MNWMQDWKVAAFIADSEHCCSLLDYYNNSGANGGGGGAPGPVGGATSNPAGPAPAAYGSYYQNEGGYSASPSASKPPPKKPPMHQGSKPAFSNPSGPPGGYQAAPPPGQSPYNPYGQGYGPGKKNFNQNQSGGYPYTTAYPSQVTGGAGGGQDYSYEGYGNQSSYSASSGASQGYAAPTTPYHNPAGYGRGGDPAMNYQYR